MSAPRNFEYSYTAPNGSSFACKIEDAGDGKPATITIQLSDSNAERKQEALRECADLAKMLEMNAQLRDAMRIQHNG